MTAGYHDQITAIPSWTHRDLALVAVLMFTALLLRIPGLGEGLWIDEIKTLLSYIRLPVPEIIGQYQSRNNHLFYSLLAHFSVAWFGESAWSIRLPATLFGVATIPAAYYLARQITSRHEAFLATAFLTASYHHVWFSQNARGYSGLILGAVILSMIFIRLVVRENPGSRAVLVYAIVAALATWIHLIAALVVIIHGIIWLAVIARSAGRQRTDLKLAAGLAVLLAGLFSLALYAPVLPQLLEHFSIGKDTQEYQTVQTIETVQSVWNNLVWLLAEFWRAAIIAIPGGWPVVTLGILAFATGVGSYLRQSYLVAAILLLPAVGTVPFVLQLGGIVYPRFLLSSLVFFLLIVVRGSFVLSRSIFPMLSTQQVTAIGLIVVLLTATMVPGAWKPKQDFVAAAEFVNRQRLPGDTVVCTGSTYSPLAGYLGMECSNVLTAQDLDELEAAHSRTWLLYSFPNSFQESKPDVWNKVRADYAPVRKFSATVNGGDIVIMMYSRGNTAQ